MVIEEFLDKAYLKPVPTIQIIIGAGFLIPLYAFKNLKIEMEGFENIPDGPVIFAMNHTDRYNYWPFQLKLWRLSKKVGRKNPFTATWVKGKYYENRFVANFMRWTGNIPVPSKGYLLAKDFSDLFGKKEKLSKEDFFALKNYVDGELDEDSLKEVSDKRVVELVRTPHGDFDPNKESYRDYINGLFFRLMEKVRHVNYDAMYNKGLNLIIFPEGTRSKRLIKGKPGVAQMAIALKVPVVPVGCNGSDKVYTGDLPLIEKNGRIVYRIGKPILLHEIERFRIEEDFVPFTPQAEERKHIFQEATDLIMERINELLDDEYKGDFRNDIDKDISSFI